MKFLHLGVRQIMTGVTDADMNILQEDKAIEKVAMGC